MANTGYDIPVEKCSLEEDLELGGDGAVNDEVGGGGNHHLVKENTEQDLQLFLSTEVSKCRKTIELPAIQWGVYQPRIKDILILINFYYYF